MNYLLQAISKNQEHLKIVNFFASWCPPCKVEHPQLMELANNYKIYGIAKKDNEENVNKWLKTNEIHLPKLV